MFDDETNNLLAEILGELKHQDNYTYSDPFTAGGGTGTYLISTPYNEECEWAILLASSGSSGSGVGSFTLSPRAAANNLAWNGTDSLGPTANGRDGNALRAYSSQLGNNTSIPYSPIWVPLTGNAALYLAITASANTTITVTVAFRRQNNPVRFIQRGASPHNNHRMMGRQERQANGAGYQSVTELNEAQRHGQGYNARAGIKR